MIEFCESEAALVGVLGHELSHIDRGHQLFYLRRQRQFAETMSEPRFDMRRMARVMRDMAQTWARPFRPEDETEADRDATRWSLALGYDAMEFAKLFARLHERDGGPRNPSQWAAWFRSHPAHADRLADVSAEVASMSDVTPQPTYIGRENLRRRVTKDEQRFD